MKASTAATAMALVVVGGPAARAQTESESNPSPSSRASDRGDQVARLELGYRGVVVTPSSLNEYFSGVSVAVLHTVHTEERFAFALGVCWDYGGMNWDVVPGSESQSSLHVNRFTLPLEGRVHFGRWGYVFARVAPGFAWDFAEAHDRQTVSGVLGIQPIALAVLTKSIWLFTVDASAGYTIPVVSLPNRPGPSFRIWLQGDAGYSWVAINRLLLAPVTNNGQTTPGVDLGVLGVLAGPFFRVGLAVGY
ncbi:MAG: hypothetical protein ABSC94_31515 [Polyangiaceae bacterium]